ncbi:MAG: Glu/Leu/Phe/Val dehydrogenase [Candidatus Kaiserbacteria bacterium]|nr:Glu/Leu/Phe/Val dehydrogenase [Candidatus Kaiserbacteria bacterium]
MNNPFQNALSQLSKATKAKQFPDSLIEGLSKPQREILVSIPVRMDDGSTRYFEGYRVQHNNVRGPYKGGIRFHPQADINEVRALAFWMTMKTAVAGIAMGGGKGGVTVDPKKLSPGELEQLSRGWVQALWRNLGPEVDVPAPDVNTTPKIMEWMSDEYEKLSGDTSRATFTGKPIEYGGSEGRTPATGLGGYYVFATLKDQAGIQDGASVAVQGMGNVGGHAATIFTENGYKVVAMSDSKGGIYKESGLDPEEVESYKKKNGSLKGFPGAKQITNAELLELPVDILIPAALENQITSDNAAKIKAKLVLELANGPTTPEADESLFGRGIPVIPDILANAGGVVVSTFEWEQNRASEHWSEIQVLEKLEKLLVEQSHNVWQRATDLNVSLRTAAFVIALERLEAAQR